MKKLFHLAVIICLLYSCNKDEQKLHLLILSGSNNHDWEKTTKVLENIFLSERIFDYCVTLKPDTLDKTDLEEFDVILSNWNSWPENEIRWPEQAENALSEFIKNGGGFVTFHSSTSAFYEWPEFEKITTAAWIEGTSHGKNSPTKVNIESQDHPVTQGMNDFFIFDELWIDAEDNPEFEVLGTATNNKLKNEAKPTQPAIMVSHYGKGRIFHTILGHDARAMRNSGFQALLKRGIEWTATGNVMQPLPQELSSTKSSYTYKWLETDTTLILFNDDKIVWQYNFNTKFGRPFFHPVYLGRNNMTCLSPDDHPWHLGQWFCWKYINGVNYWEYQQGTFQSAGVTEIENIEIEKKQDFSAEINLDIVYYPVDGENILAEKRTIKISPPDSEGKISMDYNFEFKAFINEVKLDRTPILGEKDGKSWGGYAGLSLRFSPDFMEPEYKTSWADNDSINGQNGDWLYMGFTGIDGEKVGSQIMIHPDSFREDAAWYAINTEDHPFYYVSPAYLYLKPVTLKKGEKISLAYKIVHFPGEVNENQLKTEFHNYIYQ